MNNTHDWFDVIYSNPDKSLSDFANAGLSEKNIDVHSLAQNNDKAHSLFQTILSEAEKQVGFKVQNCKLLVEAFSTSEGYVVFTLTKYKNEISPENSPKKLVAKTCYLPCLRLNLNNFIARR